MGTSGNSNAITWLLGLLVTVVAACGGDGGGGGSNAQPGMASVSVTDAPACGFEVVTVTVIKVRMHQSSSADDKTAGWTDINLNPPRKINLLDLNDPTQPNFALESLGQTPLGPGHYTQLRLVLEENNGNQPTANWIVLEGQDPANPNNRIPLETPSGIQSGIKLIHQFTVNSGQRVDLLLDFDACKSVNQTGNGKYKLKPVIKVIPFVLNGIEGFVDANLLASHVVVSAQLSGDIVRATVPNADPLPNPNRGKFLLTHLTPSIKYDVVITADDHATAVISGVPAPSTNFTTISTSSTPFTLGTSLTQSISGPVNLDNPPDDEGSVVVTARQTLNGGPTVTVRSVVAMVLNAALPIGDYIYTLILPIGAPSLAAYGPLPITPTASGQASAAGIYTVHGSAQTPTTMYATQDPLPAPVNISGGNKTFGFTLTP